jgi:threonine dehydratase
MARVDDGVWRNWARNQHVRPFAIDHPASEDELVALVAAQRHLVGLGEVVEPAGAAALGIVLAGLLPEEVFAARRDGAPLRIAVVVSGGNPEPAQFESVRAEVARDRAAANPR